MSIICSVLQRKMHEHTNLAVMTLIATLGVTLKAIQWKRLRDLALLGTCFLVLTACSSVPNRSSADLGIGDAVKTVPIEPGTANNDHPVKISPQVLASLLNDLTMKPSPESDDFFGLSRQPLNQSVFKSDQSRRIAMALSRNLAAAAPDEDIAVRAEQQRTDRYVGLKDADITAFRVFFVDGKLNLIFGTLAKDPRTDASGVAPPPIDAPKRRLNRTANIITEIGSRTKPGEGPAILLPNVNASPGGANRVDWLKFSKLTGSSNSSTKTVSQTAPRNIHEKIDSTDDLLMPTGGKDLAEKLKVIKQLRNQGLISDELYQEKLRSLVDRYLETPPYAKD
ncbi:hypothetical protein [Marinobacter sp. ELB17]|uniref:hypothetical protein n=1 Tax=Marinobacter sp. ELB17 TaxID=270374 RepID=UPI0000F37EBA|nr:hypothetical protein [Marinobacter sp. ELB17]EBA00008.1 hypothetical protein MELB17_16638 [Marinobacter sp. ELB17]